jgi:GNAT superfamily N-acetyltransferase
MLETNLWSSALNIIEPNYRDRFLEHLLRLDEEARLQRFCHTADDAYMRDYVDHFDFTNGRIIGCFIAGLVRGAAELRPSGATHSGVFEATFSLEQEWQGRGVQRALLLRAISVARAISARCILICGLGERESLRHIVTQFDAEMLFDRDDCRAWLPLGHTPYQGPPGRPRAIQRSTFPSN